MTNHCNHFRLHWVALMAIVGMLSVVSGVSASTTGGSFDTSTAGCCVNNASLCCCCEPTGMASRPALAERSVPLAMKPGRLAKPAGSCECRSSEQPAPDRTPEQPPSARRSDRDRGESIDGPDFVTDSSSRVLARLLLYVAVPPNSPVYLRNARLLI
jgi:hypothetical protein